MRMCIFREKNMERKIFIFAGWLSIISALGGIVSLAAGIFLIFQQQQGIQTALFVLSVLLVCVGIGMLAALMKLLNSRLDFHGADTVITMLIWTMVFAVALSFADDYLTGYEAVLYLMSVLFGIVFGVLCVILGSRLLKIASRLSGPVRPVSYALIVSGVAHATVILEPAGMIVGCIVDVFLAIIFFRAAAETVKNRHDSIVGLGLN